MNYQTSFEGLRQNAASGSVWLCSPAQAGAVAGLLDKMIGRILVRHGFTPSKGWMRNNIRLPFLNWLFENAVYAEEFFTHERTKPISSASDLLSGEALAVLMWLRLDTAEDDLWSWVKDNGIDIWQSEGLI